MSFYNHVHPYLTCVINRALFIKGWKDDSLKSYGYTCYRHQSQQGGQERVLQILHCIQRHEWLNETIFFVVFHRKKTKNTAHLFDTSTSNTHPAILIIRHPPLKICIIKKNMSLKCFISNYMSNLFI